MLVHKKHTVVTAHNCLFLFDMYGSVSMVVLRSVMIWYARAVPVILHYASCPQGKIMDPVIPNAVKISDCAVLSKWVLLAFIVGVELECIYRNPSVVSQYCTSWLDCMLIMGLLFVCPLPCDI